MDLGYASWSRFHDHSVAQHKHKHHDHAISTVMYWVQSSYLIFTKEHHRASNVAEEVFFLPFSPIYKVLNVSLTLLEPFKWTSVAQRCQSMGHWAFSHLERGKGVFRYCNYGSCFWRLLLFIAESLSLWVQREHLCFKRTSVFACHSNIGVIIT